MVTTGTIRIASLMLDRFFRDASGQPHNQVDVAFHIDELGISSAKADAALTYLTSRGLIERHNADWLSLTKRGITVSIDETDLDTVEPLGFTSQIPTVQLLLISDEAEVVYPVGEQLVIGRAPETDVPIDDIRASKQHAVIRKEGEDYFLEDLESANGTVINGNFCVQPTRLNHDDEIVIGRSMFIFSRQDTSSDSVSGDHENTTDAISPNDLRDGFAPFSSEEPSWEPPDSAGAEPHILEPGAPWPATGFSPTSPPSASAPSAWNPQSPVPLSTSPHEEPPSPNPRVLARSRSGLDMEQALEDLRPTIINFDRPVELGASPRPKVIEEPELPEPVAHDDALKTSPEATASSAHTEEHTSVDQPVLNIPVVTDDMDTTIHNDVAPDFDITDGDDAPEPETEDPAEATTTDIPPLSREDFEAAHQKGSHAPSKRRLSSIGPAKPSVDEWLTRFREDLGRLRERAHAAIGDKEPDHTVLLAINVLLTHPLVQGLAEAEEK